MDEFIGRSEELNDLATVYGSDLSKACCVYGRHMIGKTALLRKFCEDKRHVFLTCTGGTLNRMFESLTADMEDIYPDCPEIHGLKDLTDRLCQLKDRKRTVVVIDSYNELADLVPDAHVILREFIDKKMHDLNMMLVISSSSVKDMSEQTEDRNMPLYGRFALSMRLRPLPYRDAREFHPNMSEEDRIKMYCIAGGIPSFHLLFSEDTAKDNITEHIFGPLSFFRSLAMNAISELAPAQSAGRIMSVLSDGAASLKELSEETGFTGAAIMKTMDNLVLYGVVRKERAIGGKRDPVYRMTDGPLIFYHRIIQPNRSITDGEDTELAYVMLEEEMEMSYRPVFEEICKQHIIRSFYCLEIGRWWNRTVTDGDAVQEDVDIIAKVLLGKEESTLLCECGFFDRPTGMNELYALKESEQRIRDIGNVRYVMFSRKGFTDDLAQYAETYPTERVELVDIDSLH